MGLGSFLLGYRYGKSREERKRRRRVRLLGKGVIVSAQLFFTAVGKTSRMLKKAVRS